ncbi:MAG TPA: hypothetical protein VF934_13820, partial [Burkholderiales bacterium]
RLSAGDGRLARARRAVVAQTPAFAYPAGAKVSGNARPFAQPDWRILEALQFSPRVTFRLGS